MNESDLVKISLLNKNYEQLEQQEWGHEHRITLHFNSSETWNMTVSLSVSILNFAVWQFSTFMPN